MNVNRMKAYFSIFVTHGFAEITRSYGTKCPPLS